MAGNGITLQITAAHAEYIQRRGGRSHRGRGPFSRSVVLGRSSKTATRRSPACGR